VGVHFTGENNYKIVPFYESIPKWACVILLGF
jgi:hypothetical protein